MVLNTEDYGGGGRLGSMSMSGPVADAYMHTLEIISVGE